MAEGPLKSQRCVKGSCQKRQSVNPTEMAGGRGCTANHSLSTGGQKASVDIWTPSTRSTSPIQQRTSKGYDTRTRSPWSVTITIKLVRCRVEQITSLLIELLQRLQIQERRKNSFLPKHERSRRRPIDEQLRVNLEWQSQNWWSAWSAWPAWSQPSSSSSTTPTWS